LNSNLNQLFIFQFYINLLNLQALAEKAEIAATKLVKLKELRALKVKRDQAKADLLASV
jgi:hypothetical protein